jgi:hypothetical protein
VLDAWQARIVRVGLHVPAAQRACVEALRTASAHILVNRVGPALHPGPRRYARSWIRDGAVMAAALLRTGHAREVRDFLRWYSAYQAPDGNVPCCVDAKGPDWLAEHDSHGQLPFAVAEYFRFSGDRALAAELAPHVWKAADYLARLRAQRTTPEYDAPGKRARRGLLPESVSHEGYLAHPVHSYWDDFWALRGLADAAALARALGEPDRARRLETERAALEKSLYASIEATIAERAIDHVPASVEWADLDPSATAMALVTTDAVRRLPQAALARTYELYLDAFRRRRDGSMDWSSYTPYEIRNVAALVRLGWRDAAHELLDYFLADRRPGAWNQWPEIAWRDPRSPGHLGDLPHTWVAAEYVLALLSLFAFEDPADGSLVLAAGIPATWLAQGDAIGVEGLPTYHGELTYRLEPSSRESLRLRISSQLAPPGGILLRPPLPRPLRHVSVDGKHHEDFAPDTVRIDAGPASIEMTF